MQEDHDSEEHLRSDFLDNFLELLQGDALSLSEHFLNQSMNFFLRLNTVKENLTSTALASEATFTLEGHSLVNRYVGENQADILLADEPILVKIVDIECELDLGLNVGVVDLEESMHEFLQIDEVVTVEVEHCEEPLSDDSGQLRVL